MRVFETQKWPQYLSDGQWFEQPGPGISLTFMYLEKSFCLIEQHYFMKNKRFHFIFSLPYDSGQYSASVAVYKSDQEF